MPPVLRAFELATHPRVLMIGIPLAFAVSGWFVLKCATARMYVFFLGLLVIICSSSNDALHFYCGKRYLNAFDTRK